MKNELMLFKREFEDKDKVVGENDAIKVEIGSYKMQLEKLVLENESLKR